MDVTSISRETETSDENTKKHLDRLLSIGVIRKEAGIGRETSKGVHPVWEILGCPREPGADCPDPRDLLQPPDHGSGPDPGRAPQQGEGRSERGPPGQLADGRGYGGKEDGRAFTLKAGETRVGRRDAGQSGETESGAESHPRRILPGGDPHHPPPWEDQGGERGHLRGQREHRRFLRQREEGSEGRTGNLEERGYPRARPGDDRSKACIRHTTGPGPTRDGGDPEQRRDRKCPQDLMQPLLRPSIGHGHPHEGSI